MTPSDYQRMKSEQDGSNVQTISQETWDRLVPPPRWKRELRLLFRDGPVKYVRLLRALRRFHRSAERAERVRCICPSHASNRGECPIHDDKGRVRP